MQLEQTLQMYSPIQSVEPMQRIYTVLGLESLSASALYSKPVNKGSSEGNYSQIGDLGKIDLEALGYGITQRIDTTHGKIHLNTDIIDLETGKPVNRLGLGEVHNIDLEIGERGSRS